MIATAACGAGQEVTLWEQGARRVAWVVLNPNSRGAQQGKAADALARCLAEQGVEAKMHITYGAGEGEAVARAAAERGIPLVIAAGGDGTVSDVLQGVAETATALGVVPLGTGNVLGRYLGLREGDVAGACRPIAQGITARMDLGLASGRYFVAMAGVGLDADVIRALGAKEKRASGKLAYVGQFLLSLRQARPRRFRVCIEEPETIELEEALWALLICNTNEYTWRMPAAPAARHDDGLLDIVAIRGCPRLELLYRMAALFVAGRWPSQDCAGCWQARRLELQTEPLACWHADGEIIAGPTPPIEARPSALRVVCPRPQPQTTRKGVPRA